MKSIAHILNSSTLLSTRKVEKKSCLKFYRSVDVVAREAESERGSKRGGREGGGEKEPLIRLSLR